jgi:hypothetical protein
MRGRRGKREEVDKRERERRGKEGCRLVKRFTAEPQSTQRKRREKREDERRLRPQMGQDSRINLVQEYGWHAKSSFFSFRKKVS